MSVEELYQSVIRPRSSAEQRALLDLIVRGLAQSEPRDSRVRCLAELEGLGDEAWAGVDAQRYVDRLRSEWDPPP